MLQGCIFNWTFVCMFFLISGFPAVCGFTGFVLFLFVLVVKKNIFFSLQVFSFHCMQGLLSFAEFLLLLYLQDLFFN